MDSIKAQDIIRHIFKDEDKGVEYVTGLSITDGVEVLTKVLPELIKKAQEKNNVNDEGYFNEIGNVYRKIVVDFGPSSLAHGQGGAPSKPAGTTLLAA